MKKTIMMCILMLSICFALTGCGCSKIEYTVTFDSKGGSEVEEQTVVKGKKATEPEDPTREGYTFEGWYLDLDDKEEFDFDTKITKNITLYAKWEKGVCSLTCEEGFELDKENCKCVESATPEEPTTTVPVSTRPTTVRVSSISLSQTSLNLVVGNSSTVYLTIYPSYATNKYAVWTSSNSNVATVSNGVITATGKGSATITVTVDGQVATINVTVITQEEANMIAALAAIQPKTIEKGNTSINYKSSGCTIANTKNTTPSNITATLGKVKKVYRGKSDSTITSVYEVTCGSLKDTKTVKHTVAASTYRYTASNDGILPILKVNNGATYYTLSASIDGAIQAHKYLASIGGVQAPSYKPGTTYDMVFDNDANTTYAVREA